MQDQAFEQKMKQQLGLRVRNQINKVFLQGLSQNNLEQLCRQKMLPGKEKIY